MSIDAIDVRGGTGGFFQPASVRISNFPDPAAGTGAGPGTRVLTGGLFAFDDGAQLARLAIANALDPAQESRATTRANSGFFVQCATDGGRAEITAIDLGQFTATCDGKVCSGVAPAATVALMPGVFGVTDMKNANCTRDLPLDLVPGWF